MMNSNYSRIQINLLPPELKPGPSVRYSVLLNFLFIAATLSFIMIHSVYSLNRLASYKEASRETAKQIEQYKVNEEYYNELIDIQEKVNSYGRLISMASIDYVEMPLIMERMSGLLPDGVFLRSVSNDKPAEGSNFVVLRFQLSASKDDPALLQKTLQAFKNDKYLHDCYMSSAEVREQGIQDRLEQFGINWEANESAADQPQLLANLIEFEVQARVARPLDTEGMARTMDNSKRLTEIKFKTPPPPDEKGKKKKSKDSNGGGSGTKKTKEERKAEERAAAETGGLPPSAVEDEGGN